MPDIIQLLPDSVANQIAAGEVVQRPASVVKELLENAIDALAKTVHLKIKNAGKTLINVIDDGKGMSETDLRLSIERHATSKIKKVEDLFSLNTKGFRGEALPSIVAIAHATIKSRRKEDELGSSLNVQGSKVIAQEVCQCPEGTNIAVKNLFFNIPARRNFLKGNPVETKHILEEFLRVALIHPEVSMNLTNEDNNVYQLPKGNFRQRIVNIYGDKYNQRLVPVEEETDIVKVSGFVGKPEFARKTRGEQYFFVNNRFIKSPYLHHAVQNAFEELLASDQYPSYFLKLEIDPSKIDINIHPTKTEIKFEEERSIYAIIRTAVRQALGKFNIAPSLDFEKENSFEVPLLKKGDTIQVPSIKVDPEYNPFQSNRTEQKEMKFAGNKKNVDQGWEKLYKTNTSLDNPVPQHKIAPSDLDETKVNPTAEEQKFMQLHGGYIISQIKSGFIIIDQERAHHRILIDRLENQMKDQNASSQQLLFPKDIELSPEHTVLLESLQDELKQIGFDIRSFGKNHFIVHGIPPEAIEAEIKSIIELMLNDLQEGDGNIKNKRKELLIHSIAYSMCIKRGQRLGGEEINHLIDELFACEMPYHLPNGKPIVINHSLEDLNKQFKRK